MKMRFFMSLTLVLFSRYASAEEEMKSLLYRVKAHEFFFDSGIEFGKNNYNYSTNIYTKTSSPAPTQNTYNGTFENPVTKWKNNFSYGMTDFFSFSLGVDYSFKNTTYQNSNTIIYSYGQSVPYSYNAADLINSGFNDFRIGSSFRYLAKDSIKGDLLIGVGISPQGKEATLSQNAIVASGKGGSFTGGQSLQLATELGTSVGIFEALGKVGLDYKFARTIAMSNGDTYAYGGATDYTKEVKGTLDLLLGLATQFTITPVVSLGTIIDIKLCGKENSTSNELAGQSVYSGLTSNESAHTDVVIGGNGKFQVLSNAFVKVNYAHTFGGNINGESTVPTIYNTYSYSGVQHKTKRSADFFGLDFAIKF